MSSTAAAPTSPRYTTTLIAGSLAVMVAQIAYSLSGVLNGTYQTEFNTSGAQLVWISAAFATAMVVFELTFGVIGDLFGRKRFVLGGLAVLAVGEVVSYFAHSVHVMWLGQGIAGFGAGALYPLSLTMIAAAAPDHHARTRGIAIWAGFLSIGAAVSPVMAGALASGGHWRISYLIIIGVALVVLGTTLRAQDSSSPEGRKLDLPGQITLILGLVALIWAVTQGSELGFGKSEIVAGFVIGAALIVAFVVIESRSASPLLHLSLFNNRAFALTSVVAVLGMFAFLGTAYSTSIWLGAIQHTDAMKIGIVYLFIQGPAFVLVPLVARLIHGVSPRWSLTAGFVLIAVGGFIPSTFDVHDVTWTSFILPLTILGIGFALTVASISAVAINAVPLQLAGMASATNNLLRDLGFALGPIVISAIATPIANSRLLDGIGGAIGQSGLQDPAQIGTIQGISHEAGALAVNSLPVIPGQDGAPPLGPMPSSVSDLAFSSLGHAYNVGYLVAAVSALACAGIVLVGLRGTKGSKYAADLGTDVVHEVASVAEDLPA